MEENKEEERFLEIALKLVFTSVIALIYITAMFFFK